MSHVSHVVSMHHDAGSHSPEIVTIHDSTDHFQNITHDSSAMSEPSSPESATFDDSDLLNSSVTDVVTSQLAAAGPVGVAAAAAVATGRKRKRPHSFETNPSIRKRQQTRLLRKLKGTIDEYATRVGQQAVVLCACPGTPNPLFKVFGAAPLENCVKSLKPHILQSLEGALAQQTPTPSQDNNGLFELPPLYIDGIPTPVDKMTQAQLRAFIPLMLKYSTGRGKPGWGRESTKPPWWPEDIPWQNVRSDTRTEEQKAKLSWTNALRTTVKNCYEYHGRSDLLPDFHDGERFPQVQGTHPIVHTLTNADGTLSLVQVDATGAIVSSYTDGSTQAESTQAVATLSEVSATTQGTPVTISITEMSQGEAAAQAAVATLAEATLSDGGQLVISEHAANALAGVSESSLNTSSMVNIPVHAAAAMMQIQNSQIANAQTQYIATSIPQVAMAPHSNLNTVSASQNIQTQLVDSTGSDNPVPGASQAVEVFGAATLENCVKSLKPHNLQSLEGALAQQTPTPSQDNNGLFQLPPLCIHGIPTPVDRMTQAQLRAFIPLMLKYSTGQGKPKWGCESTKPPWWPEHIPWQNIRRDTRTEKQKAKLSWMNALRTIVRNCYVYHGRSDMLPDCQDGGKPDTKKTAHSAKTSSKPRGRSKSPSKKKSKKKGRAKSRSASPTKSNVDLMSKPAMENAYYISHNAPQFLELRGFSWEGSGPKSKKKGKKKEKKKK